MMAKWYQMLSSRSPPMVLEKICAMPTANEGAPPARFSKVFSPTRRARSVMVCAVKGKPQALIVAAAASGVPPTMLAGLLMAK